MILEAQNEVRPFVAICHGDDACLNTLDVLRKLQLPSFAGRRVLLKPNAGRKVQPRKGITTEPDVVAAACDFFLEKGADVAVGESTILGVKPLDCLESTGIAAVARERGIPVLDLDELPATKTPVRNGVVLDSLAVCGVLAQFDCVVSIPVMKTHMHCCVSLSLKNMKGCLRGREKVRLHQLPQPEEPTHEKTLDLAIADLSTVLQPDIAIVDGTVGMEGLGPSAGTAKRVGLVLASTDYLSADAVAAAIMGFSADAVPHLRLAAQRAGRTLALDEIDIAPHDWRKWTQPFERPPEELSIEFPRVNVMDCESCSACVSTLMLFLKRYYDELGDYLPLNIAIGKGHETLPAGTLCIGNCTGDASGKGIFIPGCPPVASDIFQTVRKGKN